MVTGRSLDPQWKPSCDLEIPSQPGNELAAVRAITQSLQPYQINERKLEQMKTAIAEATMNAMEHGNHFQAADPVRLQMQVTSGQVIIRVMDHGDINSIPLPDFPDIDAKLAGKQSARGWGMFLIRHMVDEMREYAEGGYHITELIWNCDLV